MAEFDDLLYDLARVPDWALDLGVRVVLGQEVLVDDATYRSDVDTLHNAYEQLKAERTRSEDLAIGLDPMATSPLMHGVQEAVKKSSAAVRTQIVRVVEVQRRLSEILTAMHTAFIKNLTTDASGATQFQAAGS